MSPSLTGYNARPFPAACAPMPDIENPPVRLAKRVIELSGCSRREAELYIEGGWVKVDGRIVEEPQFMVAQQQIELLPNAVLVAPEPATLLMHVAPGETVQARIVDLSLADRWAEDASGVRPLKRHLRGLKHCLPLPPGAGGLVVLTQDRGVERRLTDDRSPVEQEYVVEVSGNLKADLKRLNTPSCKVSWQNETRLRVAVKNPQPGQIERLCDKVGLTPVSMKRIRIGAVPMAKMPPGQWRYLATKERF